LKSKSFEGKLGPVTFDAGATAIQEFVFQRLTSGGNWSTIVSFYFKNTFYYANLDHCKAPKRSLQSARLHKRRS
jgi:hypothetical protein